jgi:adenylyl-sulfate kinase
MMCKNQSFIQQERYMSLTNHPGFVLWFTGLSGSGKTTVAKMLLPKLKERGVRVERLDGDVVRESLTKDLGFTKEDRDTNIKRVTFVARVLSRNNVAVLSSFISPYAETRDFVRQEVTNYIEVFVDAPLEVCAERDVKGLYEQAFAGEIENFTGVSDPYQAPENPDIHLETHRETPEESAEKILAWLEEHSYIPAAVVQE